jgi:hypothetical protein
LNLEWPTQNNSEWARHNFFLLTGSKSEWPTCKISEWPRHVTTEWATSFRFLFPVKKVGMNCSAVARNALCYLTRNEAYFCDSEWWLQ